MKGLTMPNDKTQIEIELREIAWREKGPNVLVLDKSTLADIINKLKSDVPMNNYIAINYLEFELEKLN